MESGQKNRKDKKRQEEIEENTKSRGQKNLVFYFASTRINFWVGSSTG